LTSYFDHDEILQKTLSLVMDYMDVEAGEIFLLADDKQSLNLVLHRGQASEAFWKRKRFNVGDGIVGLVAKTGEEVVSRDLAHDVRYLHDSVVEAGFRQMACFPLTSGGNLIGVLSAVTRSSIPLDDQDIQVITAIGSWAGLAIENARLHNDARRLAVLEERDRFGMELHDSIIQSIYGVGLGLEHALSQKDLLKTQERIQQAIDGLNQTIRDIRSYILDLQPRQLGDENLMDGLKRLLAEFRANTLAEANLSGVPEDVEDLPQFHAIALFHICQEALTNVTKHVGAKKVDVRLWSTPERVMIEIRDNGKGFETLKMTATLGHGLSNMHRRIHQVGGDVEISSVVGEGTSILAWVPKIIG
jgi:two-component system sensor histidine kinase DevS